MNRFFMTLILAVLSICSSSQQSRFGMDIGFNISKAMYKPEEGLDLRVLGGFDGGVLAEFYLNNKLRLNTELNYVINGVELNDGSSENSIKLQYLSIAILLKYNLFNRFRILAGPAHGILLTAWNDGSGTGASTQIKGLFKFTDLVLTAGAEYDLGKKVFVAMRYNHGFEQIVEDGVGFTMRNRYLSFKIGCFF